MQLVLPLPEGAEPHEEPTEGFHPFSCNLIISGSFETRMPLFEVDPFPLTEFMLIERFVQ